MPNARALLPHISYIAPSDESIAGSRITVDLAALADNYKLLSEKSGAAKCGAAIKADAYGLGLENVALTLWNAGCRIFYVAVPQEGARTRAILPDAIIYVLSGIVGDDTATCADYYEEFALRPVLNSLHELELWETYCKRIKIPLPCALHFDTGMNRLGMDPEEAPKIASTWQEEPPSFIPCLIMSHLACADDPQHPLNSEQLDKFRAVRKCFPDVSASLANSGGIFLGPDYHFDQTRPGIALYGGPVVGDRPNPMQAVVTAEARILTIRDVSKGTSVGYGATEVTKRDSRLATLSIGYADGYVRAAGSTDTIKGANVWIAGYEAPIIGRVSMDLVVVDVTDIPPEAASRGQWAELFGKHIAVDDVATHAGTISYEFLTSLGLRSYRRYQ